MKKSSRTKFCRYCSKCDEKFKNCH